MVFSSTLFLFIFIPIFFSIYYFAAKKYRNLIALLGSIFFYAWGGSTFLGLLLLSLLIDWHLVNVIYINKEKRNICNFYLTIALVMNIALLAYFKYSNFFIDNVNLLLTRLDFEAVKWTAVVLPIGISFIVFHKISYIIDIYRGVKKPTESMSTYFLYILLFPMSIAGPIIKFQDISDQLINRESRFSDVLYGLYRFSLGLFKKVWIADNIALIVNNIFAFPNDKLSFWSGWIGIFCYALQIYFDFSGYADMAIGLSRMMGLKIAENFNHPYISQNITEFWRRWHISLSSWMRDYIYIPLGGNRRSKIRVIYNMSVVFLISGFWHGANWTFIVWGMIHGLLIICDKLFWLNITKHIPKAINICITFLLVLIAWVFFRADTLNYAVHYILNMINILGVNNFSLFNTVYFSNTFILIFIFAIVITFLPATSVYTKLKVKYEKIWVSSYFRATVVIVLLFISITKCVTSTFSPFIYFRF